MDRVKLERIRCRVWSETSSPDFPKGVKVVIGDLIDALLEEEKPVATDLPDFLEGDRFTAEQIVKLIKLMYWIK